MAAGDLVQYGTVIETGLVGMTSPRVSTTILMQIQSYAGPTREADKSEIKDIDQGATRTKIFKNPRRTIKCSGIILRAAGIAGAHTEYAAWLALKPGDEVLVNTATADVYANRTDEAFQVETVDPPEMGEDGIRVGFTAVREDSMAATYGTT